MLGHSKIAEIYKIKRKPKLTLRHHKLQQFPIETNISE